jgi:tetratricopeptide (TPR) repeat protein/tRNA A-37 threonylcarbamoyl transferase component Bud32
MSDHVERITAALADRYRIERELGSGGMATVYLAQDLKHERQVAVKVLRPELAAALGSDRFLREIKIAANLNHPHIMTLHDSGEADGFLYYVMPYVDGESLRDRLNREKQLPIEDALEVAKEIADALGHAHSLGFVHRDIKPENILFEAGHAVVSDFGIARAVTEASDERLTDTGLAMGTPAYMSPEQGAGEPDVDGRSDIYSLACVLYEMLGGDPPYTGSTPQALLARKLTDPVPSLQVVRETVPEEIEHVVIKALAKTPSDRFPTAAKFVEALEGGERASARQAPLPQRRRRIAGWIAGWIGGAVGLLVILGGIALLGRSSGVAFTERDWIIIADLDNQTDEELFDRSLNTALTIAIEQSKYVNVVPRTRVEEALGRMGREEAAVLDEALAREVALREGAKAVVAFAISRVDTTYLISAQILAPETGVTVGSETVRAEGQAAVLPALDGLARTIRTTLGETLDDIAQRAVPLPLATTSSLQALKRFAEGRDAWREGRYVEARELWRSAIEIDSNFAWAHARLGTALTFMGQGPQGESHFRVAEELLDRVTQREQLWIRQLIAGYRGNRGEAANLTRMFLREYPDDRDAWFSLGRHLQYLARRREALEAYQQSIAIDSFYQNAYVNSGQLYYQVGQPENARRSFEKAFELEPDDLTRASGDINRMYGFVLVMLGDTANARVTFGKMLSGGAAQQGNGLRSLGFLEMYRGKYSAGIRYLNEAILANRAGVLKLSEYINRLHLATAFSARGMDDSVDVQLREADVLAEQISISTGWLKVLAQHHVRRGELERTQHVLDQMIARSPPNSPQYERSAIAWIQGEIALAQREFGTAIDRLELARRLWPSNLYREALALCYLRSGQLEQAATVFEEITHDWDLGTVNQQPWILAHYWLGRVHEEQGNVAEAAEYYQRLLDLWSDGDDDLVALNDARERLSQLAQRD